jgi:RNA polymerase sigma-70 factor (ECF subfamily)
VTESERDDLFRQWLAEHQGILVKIARARVATADDQEDLFQEMLLQLWLSIPRFRGDSKASTWIYRVALNTSLAWDRSHRRYRDRVRTLAAPSEVVDLNDGTSRHDHVAEIDRLYAAIRTLPKVDASIVLLHLEGLSYREMADVLGITLSNVGVRLNRAKKRLLEALEEDGHGI